MPPRRSPSPSTRRSSPRPSRRATAPPSPKAAPAASPSPPPERLRPHLSRAARCPPGSASPTTVTARPPWPARPPCSGVYPITITASNGVGSPDAQDFTLTVDAARPSPRPTARPSRSEAAGSFTVTTTGHADRRPHRDRALCPPGSASPTTVTVRPPWPAPRLPAPAGPTPLTIDAANGVAPDASQTFTLTVDRPPRPSPRPTAPPSVKAAPGAFTVTTTGDPTAACRDRGTAHRGQLHRQR